MQPDGACQRLRCRQVEKRARLIRKHILKFRDHNATQDRFESLLQGHFDALYRASRRFASVDCDAEDLVQEVCLKTFERLDEFEAMEYQRAWLLRVLYHTFIDARRRDGRAPTTLGHSIDEDPATDLPGDSQLQPDEQADRIIRIERVLAAMALLDKDDCTLVAMHDIEGMSITELVGLTGMPAGTIKSRLFRTRAKLGRLVKNKQLRGVNLRLVEGGR
jgi:RNA polymerase sigma-70 factor (ECF subfamily)